jgi:hypothetical protein
VIGRFEGKHRQIAKSRMSNEDLGDVDRRAMLDRVFTRDSALCRDVVEGGDEIAGIGRAFGSLGGKHAADIERVRVETDRRSHVELERQPAKVRTERSSEPSGLFHAAGPGRDRIADHWKQYVLDRHLARSLGQR